MKNKQFAELAVCGFDAVKAIEAADSTKIRRLYFTAERAPQFKALCKAIAARKGIYNMVQDPMELEKLSGSVHHQGVVAMISKPPVNVISPREITTWKHNKSKILILDRISNANNFGAIVRSAAFFGIEDIVISSDEAESSITTSSYRIAQGGMEYVRLHSAFSIPWLLKQLSGANGDDMTIIGTDVHTRNTLATIKPLIHSEKGIALVLGNEESGISDEVRDACTCLVAIKGSGKIESLNVAQAATLFLYVLSVL